MDSPFLMANCVGRMEGYNAPKLDKVKECQEKAWGGFIAYLYLVNSDQAKYGLLIKQLASQYGLGNNQYPKSVTAAQKILSNHQHDNNMQKSVSKAQNSDMEAVDQQEVDVEVPALSFAQLEGK